MPQKSLFDTLIKTDGLPIGAVRNLGDDSLGAYAAIWGTEKYKDVTKEWFTRDTDELTVIFDEVKAVPWLIQHAQDDVLKTTPIGLVVHMEYDDIGLYYETRITKQELYKKYISRFVESGALFTSTGTLPGGREVSKSGQILRWPIVEVTGTWIPAQWQMMSTVDPREIKSTYDFMNLVLPKALSKALSEEHDLAYNTPDGTPDDVDQLDSADVEETDTSEDAQPNQTPDSVEEEPADLTPQLVEIGNLELEILSFNIEYC